MNKKNNHNNKKNNHCEKYQLAITNYVLGEKMDITREELYGHLAQCEECQKDIREWDATHALLRAQEYDSRPESKKKREELLAKIKSMPVNQVACNPQKGETNIDVKWEFGSNAGKVYRFLKPAGKGKRVPIEVVINTLGEIPAHQGMSWLASENKLCMTRVGNKIFVFLPE